jgi:hypothetical protein
MPAAVTHTPHFAQLFSISGQLRIEALNVAAIVYDSRPGIGSAGKNMI